MGREPSLCAHAESSATGYIRVNGDLQVTDEDGGGRDPLVHCVRVLRDQVDVRDEQEDEEDKERGEEDPRHPLPLAEHARLRLVYAHHISPRAEGLAGVGGEPSAFQRGERAQPVGNITPGHKPVGQLIVIEVVGGEVDVPQVAQGMD